MSHYFVLALVPETTLPEEIERKVEAMMAPYDHNIDMSLHKHYLTPEQIERMAEHYETHDLHELATHTLSWFGDEEEGDRVGGVDENGIYAQTVRNLTAKWDWWRIGGRWDGAIRNHRRQSENGFNFSPEHEHLENNILPVRLIDHKVEAHGILTPDGTWIEQRRKEDDEEWDKRLFKIIQEHRDCYLVGMDVHN